MKRSDSARSSKNSEIYVGFPEGQQAFSPEFLLRICDSMPEDMSGLERVVIDFHGVDVKVFGEIGIGLGERAFYSLLCFIKHLNPNVSIAFKSPPRFVSKRMGPLMFGFDPFEIREVQSDGVHH